MGRFIEVALLLVALGRVDGVKHLLGNMDNVVAISGKTGGSFMLDYVQERINITRTIAPYSRSDIARLPELARTSEVRTENIPVVIHAFGKDMSFYGYSGKGVFSVLPISAFGSRYVVSTCLGSMDRMEFVVVNYNQKTDVDITLKLEGYVTHNNKTYSNGDTIHVSLDEYQVFTLKSAYDLTGTVVQATHALTVGSITIGISHAAAQQFPVRHHGTEFVLSTRDDYRARNFIYQLQVVSDQSDTEIMLNNGSTFSLGNNRVYRQNLLYNETLYFKTTRPVTATLCRKSTDMHTHGFVVVTPVKYFIKSAQLSNAYCINILTKQHVTDIEVFGVDKIPANVDWVDIPGSDYKAGRVCSNGLYFLRSANRFALYGFSTDIYNGGFHFPSDPSTTAGGRSLLKTTFRNILPLIVNCVVSALVIGMR